MDKVIGTLFGVFGALNVFSAILWFSEGNIFAGIFCLLIVVMCVVFMDVYMKREEE